MAHIEEIGFVQDEFGQWKFRGECEITLYAVMDEWEIDVGLPNGVFGCDVPYAKVTASTKAEIDARRVDRAADDAQRALYAEFQDIANRRGGFRVEWSNGQTVEFGRSKDFAF
jgi:hypothetical protein